MRESIMENIIKFVTNRLWMLLAFIVVLFYLLTIQLFDLQIVQGETYKNKSIASIAVTTKLDAQRGSIYDRYGRPVAVNEYVYTLKIDPSIAMTMADKEINDMSINLMELIKINDETYVDELPITEERPYEYTFSEGNQVGKVRRWLTNMGIELKDYDEESYPTAEETMDILKVKFGLLTEGEISYKYAISERTARSVISLRSKIYLVRFSTYSPVLVASNIDIKTVTIVEEDLLKYRSTLIVTEPIRNYPYGIYLSHILGYVDKINSDSEEEIEALKSKGYNVTTDNIGKSGIELSFEQDLKGEKGELTITTNSYGRKIDEMEDSRIEPVNGSNVYLTIDAEFQKKCYEILERRLTEILISEMTNYTEKGFKITPNDFLVSMAGSHNMPTREMFNANEGTSSYKIKMVVINKDPSLDPTNREGLLEVNKIMAEAIEDGSISVKDTIIMLFEQGVLTGEDTLNDFIAGRITPLNLLIEKLEQGEITPQMTNLDPSTGNLVVVDVRTGDVLAAPSYPSYDNNEIIKNRNQAFRKLLIDPASPMYNRPFRESLAPGSTFKMITAVAALETGIITPKTTIHDYVRFETAGPPYPSCMSAYGHGDINVVEALEVSCNYFFFEASYRMGNAKLGNKLESIGALNKYMSMFSLDEPSGVEVGEAFAGKSIANLSSPERKVISEGDGTEWYDGNTIATSIGQFLNAYPSAVMARYTAIVATKGDNYELHLLNKVVEPSGYIRNYKPVYKNIHDEISESTWDALHQGMYNVINGPKGSARGIYGDFPVSAAVKTGTAEEIQDKRPSHTSFSGFAPYEEPEIAVYVSMPFSDTKTMSSLATSVGREVMEEYFKLERVPEVGDSQNVLVR